MNWILYASASALALACADLFIKLAAGKLSNSLALLLYGSCTFLAGLGWVLLHRISGVSLHAQSTGILAALGVGVSFSLVTVGLYMTFQTGAPISIASPFIRLGGLLLASVAGFVLFHEPLTWRYAIGMVLVCAGLYLMVTR
ncbi:MAG: hypothetical protein KKE57_07150 [Proteobacteria bacterium]|nr:hypothetical protein [Pseudomonadota bacterium]